MKLKMSTKIVAITGASSGIGLACTETFLRQGAKVIALDNDNIGLTKIKDRFSNTVRTIPLDVRDLSSVEQAMKMIDDDEGRLDVLIASAAIPMVTPIIDIKKVEWENVINTNLSGLFYCSQTAAKLMLKQGNGRIIHMSSVNGLRAVSGRGAYSVAKGGVEMLTKIMAAELGDQGITVNAIAPGPVNTPMIKKMHSKNTREKWHQVLPIKRYAEPEEIAKVALFLASDEASYINGHTLPVDGGFLATGLLM